MKRLHWNFVPGLSLHVARAAGDTFAPLATAVARAICDAARLDGFCTLSSPRLVAITGASAAVVESVIAELDAAGLVAVRQNSYGTRIVEPLPALAPKYVLDGWYVDSERDAA